MDRETAQSVAADRVLAGIEPPPGDEFVITSCRRVGRTWVVIYNTESFVETGQFNRQLAGNGPILVGDDYRVAQAGTAMPVEHYVAQFESEREDE